MAKTITLFLMFEGAAENAMNFYRRYSATRGLFQSSAMARVRWVPKAVSK